MNKLLTVSEAAERLHLSPAALRRLMLRGEIAVIRMGGAPLSGDVPQKRAGRVLFDPADLDEYVARHKTPVAPKFRVGAGTAADLLEIVPKALRRFA
jgi:hypothetical protein